MMLFNFTNGPPIYACGRTIIIHVHPCIVSLDVSINAPHHSSSNIHSCSRFDVRRKARKSVWQRTCNNCSCSRDMIILMLKLKCVTYKVDNDTFRNNRAHHLQQCNRLINLKLRKCNGHSYGSLALVYNEARSSSGNSAFSATRPWRRV
jgi:hypothetical protein